MLLLRVSGRPLRIPSTSAINVGRASPEPIVAF